MIELALVEAELGRIFQDLFERDDIVVSPDLTAADVAGWDSFRHVEIVMAVQERFHMRFTSKEIDGFDRLGDLMKAVVERGRA